MMSPKHQVQKVGKAAASKNPLGPECLAVPVPNAEISLHGLHAKQPPLRMIPHAVHQKLQQTQLHLLLLVADQ